MLNPLTEIVAYCNSVHSWVISVTKILLFCPSAKLHC